MSHGQQDQSNRNPPKAAPGVGVSMERNGPDLLIHLRGQLKFDTILTVKEQVEPVLMATTAERIVLDCHEVAFVDSQALTLLLAFSNSCRQREGELVLRNPRPMVRELLKMTRLDQVFKIEIQSAGPDLPTRPPVPLRSSDPS